MTERPSDEEAARIPASSPRRLIDAGARASGEAWGVELLRDAGPTRDSAFRKQRIRAALGQQPIRRAPFALRPIVIAGVLGAAAAASAALGHWPGWLREATHRVAPAPTTERLVLQARAGRRTEGALDAPAQPEPLPDESPPAASVARASDTRHAELRMHQVARRGATNRTDREAEARPSASLARAASDHAPPPPREIEDTSAVSQAMRALRVERDPVRARALGKQYLDRYPGGALAEEALAIVVEAATAHHDADAPALGARYLRLYPAGSFRARAERAVAGP